MKDEQKKQKKMERQWQ